MQQPVVNGPALIEQIDRTLAPTPVLWWLGHGGFIFRFATITFYIDPFFSTPGAPIEASQVRHADLILSTSAALDGPTISGILESSRRAKVVLPKSAAEHTRAAGIPFDRMTTTDADLRVEYFKDGLYGRVYAIPASPDWTAAGGYPKLGYLIRFGRWTVYHGGDGAPYEGLADRLRPFNVNVALLPVGEENFSPSDAAQLASDIAAPWIVPMGSNDRQSFVAHMLGQRPEQRFKVFECGERWVVEEE